MWVPSATSGADRSTINPIWDIVPYNVEQARGDERYNIITFGMYQHNTDIQGAMNRVYDYHKELEAKFMDIYENNIPKFGELVH